MDWKCAASLEQLSLNCLMMFDIFSNLIRRMKHINNIQDAPHYLIVKTTCGHLCADAAVHARSQGRLLSQRAEPGMISNH